MSKHYWDEYLNFNLDINELNRILKFHQSNVYLFDIEKDILNNELKQEWIRTTAGNVIFSDITVKSYSFFELPLFAKKIFEVINNIYNDIEKVLCMPVLSIYSNNCDIEMGHYTFNLKDRLLIKYKDIEKEEISNIESEDVILSFFISIERGLLLYNGSGYFESILQVGFISKSIFNLLEKDGVSIYEIFIPKQTYTHLVGLNLRKQLCSKVYGIGRQNDICR